MPISDKDLKRALSTAELSAVARSKNPDLLSIGHMKVVDLRSRLRTMRDKARDNLKRQRREISGKSAPKGKHAATDVTGSALKAKILSEAVSRVERKLKKADPEPKATQVALSKAALKVKKKSSPRSHPSGGRRADKGMAPKPNKTIAPSGAFGAEGQRPVLERSRKVR